MKNPLSLEERIATTRMIGHDLMGYRLDLFDAARGVLQLDPATLFLIDRHMLNVFEAFRALAGTCSENVSLEEYKPEDLKRMFEVLEVSHRKRKEAFTYDCQLQKSFSTDKEPLYVALYNLTKNSLGAVRSGSGRVHVEVTEFTGDPPHLVYASEETSLSGDFVSFNVQDNGSGFPKDRDPAEFLELGVSTKGQGHGFGLYLAKLACKYLRSHLAISSQTGDTNITIYHPTSQS